MEPKFIIQHPVTLEMYKEWAKNPMTYNAIEKRKKSIRLRIAGSVISAVLIVLGAVSGKLYVVLMGAALLAFYLSRLFFIPNRVIKKDMILL